MRAEGCHADPGHEGSGKNEAASIEPEPPSFDPLLDRNEDVLRCEQRADIEPTRALNLDVAIFVCATRVEQEVIERNRRSQCYWRASAVIKRSTIWYCEPCSQS